MSQLEALVYASSATRTPTNEELEALLASARERNAEQGVTGALIYHDRSFVQYIEGTAAGLETVYDHIKRSSLHHAIVELKRWSVAERAFPEWTMGFTRSDGSVELMQATRLFKAALGQSSASSLVSPPGGRELVQFFWRAFSYNA